MSDERQEEQQEEQTSELQQEEVTNEEQQEEQTSEQQQEQEPEGKKIAIQNGWDPNKGNKTWQEFNLVGEVIDLKNTLKKRDKDFETLIKYHENSVEAQRLRYKQELELRSHEAKSNGDMEAVERIAREKMEVEQREQIENRQKLQQQVAQSLEQFVTRNASWYNPNRQDLVNEAVRLENEILTGTYSQRTGLPKPSDYDGVLRYIEMEMKSAHPEIGLEQQQARQSIAPRISSAQSNINKASDETSQSESIAYSKLSSEDKEAYNILKSTLSRARKPGAQITVKEFLSKWK